MLWKVRATWPDRPGTLAGLAQRAGEAGVNILGIQVFPAIEEVTDEFVLRAPPGWAEGEVQSLFEAAGGSDVVAQPCTEAALTDQPARYVQAARQVLEQPMSFPEVVAQLFDAEADPDPASDVVHDVMELTVADVAVQVHRRAPFTATEHARGEAMAALVNDVLRRSRETAAIAPHSTGRRLGSGATPEFVATADAVTAYIDGVPVGSAQIGPVGRNEDGDRVRPVDLRVDAAFQRRGIGTRLLTDSARLASSLGADEIVLTTRADNQAVLPMVMAAGLRGRIRMAVDVLTVRVPVRDLKPLPR